METETFQKYIRHIIEYVESEAVIAQIADNYSLIGDYQETVKIVHILEKQDGRSTLINPYDSEI